MSGITTSKSTIMKVALVAVIVSGAFSSFTPAMATHSGRPIVDIPYGVDDSIDLTKLNYHSCSGSPCLANDVTGDVELSASSTDGSPQSDTATGFVGVTYRLVKQCVNQDLEAPYFVSFTYDPDVDTSAAYTGTATASVEARLKSPSDLGIVLAEGVNGVDSPSGTRPTDFLQVDISGDTVYEYTSTLSATATASTTDTTNVVDEASASVDLHLSGLEIEFRDTRGPDVEEDRTSVDDPVDEIGDFWGWYQDDVNVSLNAVDPAVALSGNELVSIGNSCVKHVELYENGVLWEKFHPGWNQDTNYTDVTTEGKYEFTAYATDHQGNVGPQSSWSLGIDKRAPKMTAYYTPSQPDGNNDWYKIQPQPVYATLKCDDSYTLAQGEYSECKWMKHKFTGETWDEENIDMNITHAAAEGENVQFYYESADNAGNAVPVTTLSEIDVDLTRPNENWTNFDRSKFENGWFNAAVTVTVECLSDYPSGCTDKKMQESCTVEEDLDHYDWEIEDIAGNTFNSTAPGQGEPLPFGCDFTRPTIPGAIELLNDVVDYDSQTFVNSTPTLKWACSVDQGAIQSGLRHYQMWASVTGVTGDVRLTDVDASECDAGFVTYAVTDAPHGDICLWPVAEDDAGNTDIAGGPDPECFFYDPLPLALDLEVPLAGHLYHNGQAIPLLPQYVDATLVIGDITVRTTTQETEAAGSGARKVEIRETTENEERDKLKVTCELPATVSPCEWDDLEEGLAADPKDLHVKAWDVALNLVEVKRPYTQVSIEVQEVACETTQQDTFCGTVMWGEHDDLGDLGYRIVRDTKPDIDLTDPNKVRFESTNTAITSFTDEATGAGPYYYALVVLRANGDAVSHVTEMTYGGTEGTLSDWMTCTPFTCS